MSIEDKLSQLNNIDETTVLNGVETVAPLLTGNTIGNTIGAFTTYRKAEIDTAKRREFLAKAGIDPDHGRKYSRMARKTLERLENQSGNKLIKYAVVTAGGLLGGMIGTMVMGSFPIPFAPVIGGLGGMMLGGFIAEKIYTGTYGSEEKDCVSCAGRDYLRQRGKQKASNVEVFATLMANLPEKIQAKYDQKLENAGYKSYAEALESPKGVALLNVMMQDPALENLVRAYIDIPMDGNHPEKTVYQQYADLINSGVLDARAIVMNPKTVSEVAYSHYTSVTQTSMAMDHLQAPTHLPPQPNRTQSKSLPG